MKPGCERTDADLLTLALGEIERPAALRARLHLLVCPACRARRRRFEGLAVSLAKGLRNPTLGVRPIGRVPRVAWASAGFLALLLTILGGILATNLAPAQPSAPTASVRACRSAAKATLAPKSCPAPNLSSSHCDR